MTESQHTVRSYDDELKFLTHKIAEMGGHAERMVEQAVTAMDMADVILFMVDGKEGLTAADREVADLLRRTGKEVILVVYKVDAPSKAYDLIRFL